MAKLHDPLKASTSFGTSTNSNTLLAYVHIIVSELVNEYCYWVEGVITLFLRHLYYLSRRLLSMRTGHRLKNVGVVKDSFDNASFECCSSIE